jgi:multidrug efflux system outer membrane protein
MGIEEKAVAGTGITGNGGSPFMKRCLCGLLLFIFSTSCAVGPNYRRPKVDVPQSYRGSDGVKPAAEGQTSFANLPWWEVFQDEELQKLIRTALEQNKDVKIAAARVEEARGIYRSKRGNQFPDVGVVVAGNQSFLTSSPLDQEGNLGTINRTFVATGMGVSYEADLWGRYRRGSEAARADILAQEEFKQTVILTLLSDVAVAYFELRSLDLQKEIAQSTAALRRHSLHLTQQRLKAGVISLLDVRQAEAELAVATATIPALDREIALKENQISLLLGANPEAIPRGKTLTEQSLPPQMPLDLPSALLERRPDIRASEQQLVAANARIGEAKALLFPQINLSNILGAAFISGPVGGWTGLASLGGALFQSLFDGGKRKGNLQAAKARFEQAVLQYQKVIQQSLREVSDSLVSIKKFSEVRKEREKLVRAVRDGHRLATARYEGGVSSYLEVLEAERILFRSELELVQVRHDQLLAMVQMYRALGGGWVPEKEEEKMNKKSEKVNEKVKKKVKEKSEDGVTSAVKKEKVKTE